MLAGFILRLFVVALQIANSFIAAAPINPATSPGPCVLTILQSSSGVKRLPNCVVRAESAAHNAGNRCITRMPPVTTAGTDAITGCA